MKSARRWRLSTLNPEGRSEASLEASVIGLVPGGEELSVLDEENGFVKVSIEEGDGWVSEDYVVVATEYVTAESIEESQNCRRRKGKRDAKKAAQAAEERMKAKEKAKEGKNAEITDKSTSSESTALSRRLFIFWFRLGTVCCKLCGKVCR